ncbi:hypothetical protein ASPZODRAFT_161379 [Penicilliopsis zonata CBS 506.65]|uniref:Rap-GAP domain-containing protein n=1 Tax=Penicilliopsis zonata CBS 506.65 TaxID=1073090 RepID=A0A1L9S9G0_9EURO|nr:hypothetical protein ASPZODRAFT_161379 [Penicilliopsis zonata CBS 506.65]OJJ43811.1 hypothetical protein ASPZODRAFT_161379 [Penicilliopsis zonata CBS 506.65]
MSSDDAPSPPHHKPSTSSFAEVFKTLGVRRSKSQSPVSQYENGGEYLSPASEGRRSSRVVFGFESMHRGSVVSNSSDTASAPEYETLLKALAQRNSLAYAIDEAEHAARALPWFNAEQSVSLWEAGSYLLHHESSPDARRSGSKLMEALAMRQDLPLPTRRTLFEAISSPMEPDLIAARVQALISLSDHGRKLEFTDSSVLPIVTTCLGPLFEVLSSARSKARKSKLTRSNGLSIEETSFSDIFQFAVDLIALQRKPPSDDEIDSLLEQVFLICRKTSVAGDIKNSLALFDAVILYADVPDRVFSPLLEVLCSIHASVKSLSGPTSRAVRNLAKSRRQTEMVNILHSFLLESSGDQGRNLNVIRGTIYAFADLVRAHSQHGMPQLSFDQLVDSLQIVLSKDDGRIEADVLELGLNIMEGEYIHVALGDNWSRFIDILLKCSHRVTADEPDGTLNQPRSGTPDDTSNILAYVNRIASVLEGVWDQMNNQQKLDTGRYFMEVSRHIDPSQADIVINLLRTEGLCSPENPNWVRNCQRLISCFVRSIGKPSDIRILALDTLKDAFPTYESLALFQEQGLLEAMLRGFSDEDDLLFLESLVSFIVEISMTTGNEDTFKMLVDTISAPMTRDLKAEEFSESESPLNSPTRRRSSTSVLELSLANVCAVGLVKIFLRSLNSSANKTTVVFETILGIAQSPERPSDARLTVLKLLFRLRCDSSGSITVISASEYDFLSNVLGDRVDVGVNGHGSLEDGPGDFVSGIDNMQSSSFKDTPYGILSKSIGRASSLYARSSKLTPPVWTYASPQVLPEQPPDTSSPFVYAYATPQLSHLSGQDYTQKLALKANMWLEAIISLLQRETNWDIYSYVLTHLGPQLRNKDFFNSAIPQVKLLRSVLCEQIKNETFREPPGWTGVKKTDVAVCIFDCLSMLIGFHDHFAKSEEDELVRAFMLGIIGSWSGTSRGCIHALFVCCYEIPLSVTKSLTQILDKMSKVITMSNIAVHILEFLALLARLPDVYVNLREEEIRTVFGICIRVLQTSREQRHKVAEAATIRSTPNSARLSGGIREMASSHAEAADTTFQDGISRYIYALTHHVMVFWFLSLKIQDRPKHVNWITSRLIFMDEYGKETVEEQTQVFIDLMQRATFSDLGETIPFETFPPSPADGPASKKSWIVGTSIVTVETAGVSGLTQITKRQASGTTYAMYQQRTAPVLPHQVPPTPDAHLHLDSMRTAIFPSHVLLQLTTTAFPTPTVMQPIPLPDDDMTRRAISTFDRNDIVDGHKVGVIYVDHGQTTEAEILANTSGSADYEYFLSGLGTKVQLQGAQFNTQGLHPSTDGQYTYAWRDRVTEIVYHVPTMMPTDFDNDPNCINKKRHIGNDFVNVVFNRSNLPFAFDTIPSQFNFVNIVISPVSRIAVEKDGTPKGETVDFDKLSYEVKLMSKPGFPEISPAATTKVISGKNLAAFVRTLALNASVFSHVWNSHGGEHISSWRNRLREIKRLRERVLGQQSQASEPAEATYPGYRRNTKANIHSEELPSRLAAVNIDPASDWNAAAETNILQNLDFSKWSR